MDPATLSWEDSLTLKYYETLFREYALVSLKHYSSGAVRIYLSTHHTHTEDTICRLGYVGGRKRRYWRAQDTLPVDP